MRNKVNIKYILSKASGGLFTLLLVTLISFILMNLSPIDPAEAYVKRNSVMVTESQVEEARINLGLDKPLVVQYFSWIKNALNLDFGISLTNGHPVLEEVKKAIPTTVHIVAWSTLFMVLGVIILGCIQYMARGKKYEKVIMFIEILGISIPAFYFASMFIDFFAIRWKIISVTENSGLSRYIPAALCLSISGICFYAQMLSHSLIREMDKDYCIFAKCRGLKESRILIYHALPHAIIDLIPNFTQMIGLCFAGAAIVERVFSQAGIGYLIIDSVIARDAPLTHAAVLVFASALIIMDFVGDILQRILKKEM